MNVASYVLFGRILTFLMLGIALVLVTRILGPAQYGIYTLAVAFAGIFASIGYFGIGTAINKFIAENREKRKVGEISEIFSSALFLVVVVGIILAFVSFALSSFISGYIFHTSAMANVIKVVSFWIIAAMLFGAVYDSLLGFSDGKDITITATVQAFLQGGISIVLAVLGFGALAPVFGLVIGYFAGFAVGIVIMFRHNGLWFTKPNLPHLKKLLDFSWPVAGANIFSGIVGSFGLVFLGYFVAPAVIGNVGIASRTSSLISVIFDSISFAILPTFSAMNANKKLGKQLGKVYGYTVYLAVLVVSPMLFYMAVFSLPFSYTVFGSSYTTGPLYISIISMGLLVGIAGSYANTLLIGMGRVKLALKYNLIAYIVALLLFLLLIPVFGGIGYAIVSFLVLPLLIDTIFINRLRYSLKINFRIRKIAAIIASDVIVSMIVSPLYLVAGGWVLLALAAIGFLIIYPIVAVILGGAEKGDISTIKELSKGIPLAGPLLSVFADYAGVVVK